MEEASSHPPAEPAHPGVPLAPPGIVAESDVRTHSPGAAVPTASGHAHEEGLGELPAGYDDGRLVCLPRDPCTAFVYWDLARAQIEQAFGDLGEARAALKLWALRGELLREVEVHLEARGWYLRDLPPGAEFRLELWALGEKGARMLRSARPVRLPPAIPSEVAEELYLTLPLDRPLTGAPLEPVRPQVWSPRHPPHGWEQRGAASGARAREAEGAAPEAGAGPGAPGSVDGASVPARPGAPAGGGPSSPGLLPASGSSWSGR